MVMAPRKVAKPRSSAKFYRSNAEARAKKKAYDTEFNRKPEQVAKRTELKRERVKRGMDGKGGPDLSHTKNGRLVKENVSANRARNRGKK
jgi:hypothetical protein